MTVIGKTAGPDVLVAGYVGRSPRICRDALDGWLATSSPAAPVSPQPGRRRGRKTSDTVEAAWRALG